MQVPEYLQHVALVCARFKTLEKELDAVRTFPGVSVFAHAQDARETATAPVQAQAVVDLSVTGAMSGAAYSIRLYLPASSASPLSVFCGAVSRRASCSYPSGEILPSKSFAKSFSEISEVSDCVRGLCAAQVCLIAARRTPRLTLSNLWRLAQRGCSESLTNFNLFCNSCS